MKTGAIRWTFHTIPHPGEVGYDTWPPDAWKYAGGANTWGEITIDTRLGIAYFPVGSPTYDYYGADRPGANLFGSSIVALDGIEIPETYRYACTYQPAYLRLLFTYLRRRYGIAVEDDALNGRYERYCGDAGTVGKGEILRLVR